MHAGFPSRLRRPLIASAVLLAVASAVIILTFRWVFDPGAVRAAAEGRLSMMLGQAVTIGDISVDLLPVPALVGSDIRVGRREEAHRSTSHGSALCRGFGRSSVHPS